MKIIAFMRDLVAKGMSWEDAAAFAERFEEGIEEALESVRPAKTQNAQRQARWRERRREHKVNNVTNNVISNATNNVTEPLPLSPSSPTPPPSTIPNQLPPIVPQASQPAKPKTPPKPDDLAEKLWTAASQASRTRSGRGKVRKAVADALRAGADPASLEASVRAICRDSGDFAKGLHLIIEGEHWRDHATSPDAKPSPATPEQLAFRARHFRDTGEWRDTWGPRPTEKAA